MKVNLELNWELMEYAARYAAECIHNLYEERNEVGYPLKHWDDYFILELLSLYMTSGLDERVYNWAYDLVSQLDQNDDDVVDYITYFEGQVGSWLYDYGCEDLIKEEAS